MTTQQILEAARTAKSALALASGETRQQVLLGMADALCDPEQIREILAANALRAGISREGALEILDSVTTEEALAVVNREGLMDAVMGEITARVHSALRHRAGTEMLLGAVMYSNRWGYLGQTESAEELMGLLRRDYPQKEEI